MTSIFYSDQEAISADGRFTLEARSPSNGAILTREGLPGESIGSWDQRDFRYQLVDTATRRILWERWQSEDEGSPSGLFVSNEGWSIIRTHRLPRELMALSPSGETTVRVRILPQPERALGGTVTRSAPPVFDWGVYHGISSSMGFEWAHHSWPYFLRHADQAFFIWRTAWDERLVLGLDAGTVIPESEQQGSPLAAAMDEEEKRLSRELLHNLHPRLDSIARALADKDRRDPALLSGVEFLKPALRLAAVHGLRDCIPLMLPWAQVEGLPGGYSFHSFGGRERIDSHGLRPLLYHSLRLLGELPPLLPAYDVAEHMRFRLPWLGRWMRGPRDALREHLERPLPVEERFSRIAKLDRKMSAHEVLELLGVPDFVTRQYHRLEYGHEQTEEWQFDFRLPEGWQTLSITWEERENRRRIKKFEQAPSSWLQARVRDPVLLCNCSRCYI